MDIVIDTNALVYAAKEKIDLFSALAEKNYKPIVPTCVTKELKSLTHTAPTGAEKQAAKLAIQLIAHAQIKPTHIGTGPADDLIVGYAKNHNAAILSNDKPLKQLAKAAGLKVLSIGKNKQIR